MFFCTQKQETEQAGHMQEDGRQENGLPLGIFCRTSSRLKADTGPVQADHLHIIP